MTDSVRTTTQKRAPMDSMRKTALVAGILYLITFVSIPTLVLYGSAATRADHILGASSDTGVLIGAFLELVVALACIGTAVTLFPVVKRQNEGVALGFVATRTLEATVIFVGVFSILSLVTLRQYVPGAVGADATSLAFTGRSLAATYNWTFLLGQTLMPCMNALLLGSLLYRSGLVPRAIPALGLIGAPLLLTATVAVLFGLVEHNSSVGALAALPIAIWELSLGLWLTFKGFKATAPIMLAAAADAGSADGTASRTPLRPVVATGAGAA